MKKIFKFFGLAALSTLALTSCLGQIEYEFHPYISVDTTSVSADEDCGTVTIKVSSHNLGSKSATATFKIVDGTAKAGQNIDFASAPTLTFNGDEVKDLVLNVVNNSGVYTGNLSCMVELASASDAEVGGWSSTRIAINDKDHPLLALFGEYTMKAVNVNTSGSYVYPSWTMTISEVPGDVSSVRIDPISYFMVYWKSYMNGSTFVTGKVSKDMKTITIPVPQSVGATVDNMFDIDYTNDPWTMYLCEEGMNITLDEGEVVFTMGEDGTWTTETDFGFAGKSENSAGDWFYYYMNNVSSFNPEKYPTCFKKN